MMHGNMIENLDIVYIFLRTSVTQVSWILVFDILHVYWFAFRGFACMFIRVLMIVVIGI